MRHLAIPFFFGALLLPLTAGLHSLGTGPTPDAPEVAFAFTQSAGTVPAYDFVEVTVTVPKPIAKNPFTDATLTGQFRCGDAEPVVVQGFCDSADGGIYRIRFMPSRPGKHTYQVTFHQRNTERKHIGTFEATDGKRRGTLRVDKDHPWHFVWEGTGEHYFFNGTTAFWLMGWQDESIIKAAGAGIASGTVTGCSSIRFSQRPAAPPPKRLPCSDRALSLEVSGSPERRATHPKRIGSRSFPPPLRPHRG